MSNFFRKGNREQVRKDKKEVKHRMKRMYEIFAELDRTAVCIFNSKERWDEDNIVELAGRFTDIEISGMEKFLLLGKLQSALDHYNGQKDREINGTDVADSISEEVGGGNGGISKEEKE
jgi:hypothetical protein